MLTVRLTASHGLVEELAATLRDEPTVRNVALVRRSVSGSEVIRRPGSGGAARIRPSFTAAA